MIMDARELRIGNWYKNKSNDVKLMYQQITYFEDAHYVSVYCEPIPITEEWLLRFGFEKIQEGFFESFVIKYWNNIKTVESKIKLSLECLGDGETGIYYIAIWIGADSVVHLYYVHQLQNLYFALTGKDLTIKDNDSFYELEKKHRNGC